MDDTFQLRNPFLRRNPYFVPQKFYSEERNHNQNNNLIIKARHQNYLHEEKSTCNARVGIELIHHQRQNRHADYQYNERKQGKLKKRHIGYLQNPFYRKHLMEGKENIKVEDRYYPEDLQTCHQRLFSSSKQNSPMKDIQPYQSSKKIPSVKHLEVGSIPGPRYLLQELKIKLKSQTYMDNNGISHSKSSISQAPMTLSKSLKHIEQPNNIYPPQTLTYKGKVYFKQPVSMHP